MLQAVLAVYCKYYGQTRYVFNFDFVHQLAETVIRKQFYCSIGHATWLGIEENGRTYEKIAVMYDSVMADWERL